MHSSTLADTYKCFTVRIKVQTKINMENNTKCFMCEAIKDKQFPFNSKIDDEPGNHHIDTEGCVEDSEGNDIIKIFFCPVCGKELPCGVCRGSGEVRVDMPVYQDAGSPTADIGSAPCPVCKRKVETEYEHE